MPDRAPTSSVDLSSGGNEIDSFGRLRVSNQVVLFESFFTFDLQDTRWTQALTGSGTVTRDTNANTANLNVGTASGDKVVRRSRRYIPYQAGRSQHFSMSFIFNAAKTNLRQRIGCFDDNDGIFLQLSGSTVSFVQRTSTSGSPSDSNAAAQSSWNIDKLDGTGPSQATIDFTKIQLLIIDYGWQAAGSIRVGFLINGEIVYAHVFHTANVLSLPFMKSGAMPIRLEIENTGATSGASTMKTVCFMASSESGFNPVGLIRSASTGITAKSVSTTLTPIISIRLEAANSAKSMCLINHTAMVITNDYIEMAIVKNATLTGASFGAVGSDSIAEFDVGASAATGGTTIYKSYTTQSGNGAVGVSSISDIYEGFSTQLGSLLDGTTETLTLLARTTTGTADMLGALTWREFP